MKCVNETPELLLYKISQFLRNADNKDDIDSIIMLIQESPSSDLISSFAFIGHWVSSNIDSVYSINSKEAQSAFKIYEQIILKIPTILLLSSVYFKYTKILHQTSLLYDFNNAINTKVARLRSYENPFFLYKQFYSSFQTYPEPYPLFISFNPSEAEENADPFSSSDILDELVNDISYKCALFNHVKRMILNRAPLETFKNLSDHHNIKTILTRAIIEILKELNATRDATQEQLLFAFSSIFLYIHAFAFTNDLDGQMLCQYLQTRPFLSPFCILAMTNHIPPNLYLFNLLAPHELPENQDENTILHLPQYTIANLAKNHTLDKLISHIPTILSNYFLTYTNGTYNTNFSKGEKGVNFDNEFLSFIHLSSQTLYNKMKVVFNVAKETQLGPLHVSAMSIFLLRCITFSLQRTLIGCCDSKMFTDKFCHFLKAVFAHLAVAFPEQLMKKFFDMNSNQPILCDLVIKGSLMHLMPLILPQSNYIIRYCINQVKYKECAKSGQLMIQQLLQYGSLFNVNPLITEQLLQTENIIVALEYIDLLPSMTLIRTMSEYLNLLQLRQKLIDKFGLTIENRHDNLMLVDKIDLSKIHPDSEYTIAFQIINMSNLQQAIREISRISRDESKCEIIGIMRILTLVSYTQQFDYCQMLVDILKELLGRDQYSENGRCRFELRTSDYILPIAFSFVSRLLHLSFNELALDLLHSLKKHLKETNCPLHLITNFIYRNRNLLNFEIISILEEIILSLPSSDVFYLKFAGDRITFISTIATFLVDNDMVLIQNASILNSEYQSHFTKVLHFCQSSLLITRLSNVEIAELLSNPLTDVSRIWSHRDKKSLALAKLATTLNNEAAYHYFYNVVHIKPSKLVLLCGRFFLISCRIDLFKLICLDLKSIIASIEQFGLFMRIFLPCFIRLRGDENTTTLMVCTLLEILGEFTDKVSRNLLTSIEEDVIDAIGLLYLKVGLKNSKDQILQAVSSFTPDLHSILNACFQ